MAGNKKTCHIALTGMPGSGKSIAAEYIQSFGFFLIDADKIGHSCLEKQHIKEQLTQSFGFIDRDSGEIDREKLGGIVFCSPEKLSLLNEIVWPEILFEIKKYIKDHKRTVTDAAVLSRWNIDFLFNIVFCILSDPELILKRLKKRGWKDKKINFLIKNHQSQNIPPAYIIIHNNGSVEDLKRVISNHLFSRGII